MEWQPEEQAWQSYINFELRYKELDRARSIYERFCLVHPEIKNWIKLVLFYVVPNQHFGYSTFKLLTNCSSGNTMLGFFDHLFC